MDLLGLAAQQRAHETPARLAVWTPQGALTFAQLQACTQDLAHALRRAGIQPSRAVAVALPNGVSFVPCLLALRRLGLPVALVSPLYQDTELRAIFEGARPQALLTTPALARRLAASLAATHVEEIAVGESAPAVALVFAGTPEGAMLPTLDDAALIKFSSGSTGIPKGIVLTDGNLAAEGHNIVQTMALAADDRILATVSLAHSYGFDLGVLAMLFSGAALVLPDFFVPRRIVSDLREHQISVFLGVPDLYRRWLDAAPAEPPPPLTRLRYLLSCTAPLDASLISDFHARCGGLICQHYGSSETGAVALHDPVEVLAYPHAVGRAMHNVDLRIVTGSGGLAVCGEVGEVVVTSQAVARRYLMGGPAEDAFLAGAFRTGDLGALDVAGRLALHGRLGDIINIGGMKVSPAEVRTTLERHPAVREAAVIAAWSADGAPQVWAAVTLRNATTAAELRVYCYSQLAAYKVPQRIEIRGDLPRGATGKTRLRPTDFSPT